MIHLIVNYFNLDEDIDNIMNDRPLNLEKIKVRDVYTGEFS